MKKYLGVLLALMLCLSLGFTTMAAPSPTAVPSVGKVLVDGVEKDVKVSIVSIANAPAGSALAKVAALLKDDASLATVVDPSLAGKKLIQLVDVSLGENFSNVTITFNITGVKKGDQVTVIHYVNDKWETFAADQVGDGTVTATFNSLSPVGFVVDSQSAAASINSAAPASAGTSPKTGEADAIPYLEMFTAVNAIAQTFIP